MKSAFKPVAQMALVTLALAVSAVVASAQDAYKGKFTLPFETHWNGIVLPAGDYSLRLHSTGAPYTLSVRGEGKSVMVLAAAADSKPLTDQSQLTLVKAGDTYAVENLDAGQIGVKFDYQVKVAGATQVARLLVPILPATTATAGK